MKPFWPFIAVPKAVVARKDMRPAEKFLLGALISGAEEDGTYRVRIEILATKLGVGYRTARAAADFFAECLMRMQGRAPTGSRRTERCTSSREGRRALSHPPSQVDVGSQGRG